MAIQVEQKVQLEGQVRASIAMFGAGVTGSKQGDSSWQTQLPSQLVLDNQWYLYLLCQEYEAGRMSRDQYCTASSSIWARITGSPISADGCMQMSASAALPVPTLALQPEPTASSSAEVPRIDSSMIGGSPTVMNPPATSGSRRWISSSAEVGTNEMFGPLDNDGVPVWYLFNGQCISLIGNGTETVIAGDCAPWTAVQVTIEPTGLHVVADDIDQMLHPADAPGNGKPSRSWAGFFIMGGGGKSGVTLTFEESGRVAVGWMELGCQAVWQPIMSGTGWWKYQETVRSLLCANNGTVTVRQLSSDAVLLSWSKGAFRSIGIARPQ